MTMSVGTYSVLSLKRARICFRQLSQARRRWAGAPLQQERRSQCVKSRVQSPKSFLPLHCTEAENELFPPRWERAPSPAYTYIHRGDKLFVWTRVVCAVKSSELTYFRTNTNGTFRRRGS